MSIRLLTCVSIALAIGMHQQMVAAVSQSGVLSGSATVTIPPATVPNATFVTIDANVQVTGQVSPVDSVLRSSVSGLVTTNSVPLLVDASTRGLHCLYDTPAVASSCALEGDPETTSYSLLLTGDAAQYSVNASLARSDINLGEVAVGNIDPSHPFTRFFNIDLHREIFTDSDRPIEVIVRSPDSLKCTEDHEDCTVARVTVGVGSCPGRDRVDRLTTATFSTKATVIIKNSVIRDILATEGPSVLYVMLDMPLNTPDFPPACASSKDVSLELELGKETSSYISPLLVMFILSFIAPVVVLIYTEVSRVKLENLIANISPTKEILVAGSAAGPNDSNHSDIEVGEDGFPASADGGSVEQPPSHAIGDEETEETKHESAGTPMISGDATVADEALTVSGAAAPKEDGSASDPTAVTSRSNAPYEGMHSAPETKGGAPSSGIELSVMGTSAAPLKADSSENPRSPLTVFKLKLYWVLLFLTGLYFAIPAFQAVSFAVFVADVTNSQDYCFYNFECYRPLGDINTVNGLASNIPYLVLGVSFVLIHFRRKALRRVTQEHALHTARLDAHSKYGLQSHSGLRMAGGAALFYAGVFSAAYHVCPTSYLFQFDSSYMIAYAGLLWMSLYGKRHKLVPHAPQTLASLAFVFLLNLFGTSILHNDRRFLKTFWVIVTFLVVIFFVLHAGTLFYRRAIDPDFPPYLVSFRWLKYIWRWRPSQGVRCSTKADLPNILLLVAEVVISLAFTIYEAMKMINSETEVNGDAFSKYLMGLFIINYVLYYLFYMGRKVALGETFLRANIVYLCLWIVLWIVGLIFFTQLDTTSKVLAPAASRELNHDCVFMDFWGPHDLWHLFSSNGAFFILLHIDTLDEPLWTTPRENIPVF